MRKEKMRKEKRERKDERDYFVPKAISLLEDVHGNPILPPQPRIYPDKSILDACPHRRRDGECPECEREQRKSLPSLIEEEEVEDRLTPPKRN